MFKAYIWKLFNLLNKYIAKPRMIVGYHRYDNIYLPLTRLSNTVDITYPAKLDIADNVYVSHYSILECSNGITIEEGCQIAAHVSILSHSSHDAIRLYGSHYIEHNGRHKGYMQGSVFIGKYTFIGPYSVIMPNTRIGKGSLISAYSFVKGKFPDFAVIAGNPAKIVGDTRKRDADYLAEYPELQAYYAEWAK